MIQRIQSRRDFDTLSRDGRRIRRSSLWCLWCPLPHTNATRVAFSIGRACGPAVQRNRLRRRLRSILREVDRMGPSPGMPNGLPPGLLLIGARPDAAELTFDQLQRQAVELCRSLPPSTSTSTGTASTGTTSTGTTSTGTASTGTASTGTTSTGTTSTGTTSTGTTSTSTMSAVS